MSGRQQTHYVGDGCPSGHRHETPWIDCERCDGFGYVPTSRAFEYPQGERGTVWCGDCNGTGRADR